MRRYSITDKFIIASFLISMVIIVIVASYSFFKAKTAILDRTFNQLNSVRTIKTNLIENFFKNCQKEVKLAQTSLDIKSLTESLNKQETSSKFSVIDTTFTVNSNFLKALSHDYYNKIYLIGKNKKIVEIKKGLKPNTKDYYEKIWNTFHDKEQILLSDYQTFDTIVKPVSISAPIKKNKSKVGLLVFEIAPKAIDAIMLNDNPLNGLGVSGESYLVGQDLLMRSSSRFTKNSVLITKVETTALKEAFQNISASKTIKDYRDIKVLSSYGKISIPNLNWVLLAEIDYKEATIPIYQIRYEIIFISIFIFFIVLIIVIVLSKKITKPIEKLNEAVHEIGQGNLDVELQYEEDDEIGELTDTFNIMTQKLKLKSEELEAERIKSMRSLIDGQEIERQRLSRELHDSLGQLLIALKLKYESATSKKELGELFDKTIEETRRISNNLMPAALAEFGLTTALRNICNDISENTNIEVQFKAHGTIKSLDLEVKIYLFRIIQEALTNIIKHAQANSAIIDLNYSNNIVNIRINDNGIGFDTQAHLKKNSNGLNNIKDRVSLLNGTIHLSSKKNKGTLLVISIPITIKEHECY